MYGRCTLSLFVRFFVVLLVASWTAPIAIANKLSNIPEPLVTDRPTDSVSPIVVPKGSLQFETGYKYSRFGSVSESKIAQTFPELLLRYGLGERYELRLFASGWNFREIDNETKTSFSDITLGTKIELMPARGNWAITSVLVDLSLPSGSTA
jgi:hypothetical protein